MTTGDRYVTRRCWRCGDQAAEGAALCAACQAEMEIERLFGASEETESDDEAIMEKHFDALYSELEARQRVIQMQQGLIDRQEQDLAHLHELARVLQACCDQANAEARGLHTQLDALRTELMRAQGSDRGETAVQGRETWWKRFIRMLT